MNFINQRPERKRLRSYQCNFNLIQIFLSHFLYKCGIQTLVVFIKTEINNT